MAKPSRKPANKPRQVSAIERYDRFVSEYVKDCNATRAAKSAGYAARSAGQQGHDLLKIPYIQRKIAEFSERMLEANEIEASDVLKLNWQKATANINAVVQLRRGACRYCHGKDHAYQWRTRREFEAEFIRLAPIYFPGEADERDLAARALLQDTATKDLHKLVYPGMPTFEGGAGYKHGSDPDPGCPECEGDGVERVHIPDTRTLSGAALAIYEGVEQKKDGTIKVHIAGRGEALDRVAKIMGLYRTGLDIDAGDGVQSLLDAINEGSIGFTPTPGQIPRNAQRRAAPDSDGEVDA